MGDAASTLEHSILIGAAPTRVLGAFFDPDALHAWWHTSRSVTTPRALGIYALEWAATEPDDVLGRLGGVFYGIVMEYRPGRELFIADAWWLPPDTEPLGPMALTVRAAMDGPACRLTIVQTGFGEGPRWARYHDVIARGWKTSLAALKAYAEADVRPS